MTEPVSLGPWRGVDNYHSALHSVFQPGERPAAVTVCDNYDISDDGWLSVRNGLTEQVVVTAGLTVFPYETESVLLLQDGTSLYSIDPSNSFAAVELITGLSDSAACMMCEHAGQVFVSDGTTHKVVTSKSTTKPWGLAVPPSPTLGTTVGTLAEGRYLVSCTLVDSEGNEHGCSKSTTISVDGAEDITVELASSAASATHVSIYSTVANGSQLYWVATIEIGSLPYTMSAVRASDRPLRHQHLRNPISMDGIFSFLGYLLLYKDNYIIRSEGIAHHLFNARQGLRTFPKNIKGGVGLKTGFWVTTEKGAWFVGGAPEPSSWSETRKGGVEFATGGISAPGSYFPSLQTSDQVALFICSVGLAIGLPSGELIYPHRYQLSLDVTGKQASFAFDDSDDLIFTLR